MCIINRKMTYPKFDSWKKFKLFYFQEWKGLKTSYIIFYIRGLFYENLVETILTCQNVFIWCVINNYLYTRVLRKTFTDMWLYSTKTITVTWQYSKKLILVLVSYSTNNFCSYKVQMKIFQFFFLLQKMYQLKPY